MNTSSSEGNSCMQQIYSTRNYANQAIKSSKKNSDLQSHKPLKGYPHDTIVVYNSSLWYMHLCYKSIIPACYLLTNVAVGPEDSYDWNQIHQNEQLYVTVASCKWTLNSG